MMWRIRLGAAGTPILMPLPGGGVVLSISRQMWGIARSGRLLWTAEPIMRPYDWALTDDHLVFTTLGSNGPVFTADEAGLTEWDVPVGGRPVTVDGHVVVYDEDGVYRLNPDTRSAELLYELPLGFVRFGDAVALPDGGVLVAHMDTGDERLIALDLDGSVRWERSYSEVIPGRQRLLVVGESVLLVSQESSSTAGFTSSTQITIYWIDTESAELTRIFAGGTRSRQPGDMAVYRVDADRVLIDIGGANLVLLDSRVALEVATEESNSP
jgi:outer membrane protein assembly factor BamB